MELAAAVTMGLPLQINLATFLLNVTIPDLGIMMVQCQTDERMSVF